MSKIVAHMAFDKNGACELFIDEDNAKAFIEDGGHIVDLTISPRNTVRPAKFDPASSRLMGLQIQKFKRALKLVKTRHPLMTVSVLITFLNIAEWSKDQKLTLTQLAKRQGGNQVTIFRQCEQLSYGMPGKPGMHLIRKLHSQDDARVRFVQLTSKGADLMTEITSILESQEDIGVE